jgi:hypothetical protein
VTMGPTMHVVLGFALEACACVFVDTADSDD